MAEQELHDDAIIIDGLIIANWGPDVFEECAGAG